MRRFITILFVALCFILVSFNLIKKRFDQSFDEGVKPSAIKIATPTSFQECNELLQNLSDSRQVESAPFCTYWVEEGDRFYQQCVNHGGEKIERAYANCPGCGFVPARCKYIYVDPNFVLPKSHAECMQVSSHGAGKNYCLVQIPSRGYFDEIAGQQLLQACLQQGGINDDQAGSCELRFYEK